MQGAVNCARLAAMSFPTQFASVTVLAKANTYFDNKVVSHTVIFPDQSRKTLGLIYPGSYHFGTNEPERMDIVAGSCTVLLDGETQSRTYEKDSSFSVPGKSGFTITVTQGLLEYICSYS